MPMRPFTLSVLAVVLVSASAALVVGQPLMSTDTTGVCVDSAGNVYSANWVHPPSGTGWISRFDANGTSGVKIVSDNVHGLACDSTTGQLIAARHGLDKVSTYTFDGTFVADLMTRPGCLPYGVAKHPTTSDVYVTCLGTREVVKISGGMVTVELDLTSSIHTPTGVTVLGNQLYITAAGSNSVLNHTLGALATSYSVLATFAAIGQGPAEIDFDHAGNLYFTTNWPGHILKLDPTTTPASVTPFMPPPPAGQNVVTWGAWGLSFDASRQTLYVSRQRGSLSHPAALIKIKAEVIYHA